MAFSSTSFKPGQSGNPTGRPRVVAEVQALARSYTEDAIRTLVEIMGDVAQPAAARVSAAQAILDRGYGKPAQTINANVKREIVELTDAELAIIASLAAPGGNGTAAPEGGEGDDHRLH